MYEFPQLCSLGLVGLRTMSLTGYWVGSYLVLTVGEYGVAYWLGGGLVRYVGAGLIGV